MLHERAERRRGAGRLALDNHHPSLPQVYTRKHLIVKINTHGAKSHLKTSSSTKLVFRATSATSMEHLNRTSKQNNLVLLRFILPATPNDYHTSLQTGKSSTRSRLFILKQTCYVCTRHPQKPTASLLKIHLEELPSLALVLPEFPQLRAFDGIVLHDRV